MWKYLSNIHYELLKHNVLPFKHALGENSRSFIFFALFLKANIQFFYVSSAYMH